MYGVESFVRIAGRCKKRPRIPQTEFHPAVLKLIEIGQSVRIGIHVEGNGIPGEVYNQVSRTEMSDAASSDPTREPTSSMPASSQYDRMPSAISVPAAGLIKFAVPT